MDKYEAELALAIEKANIVPSDIRNQIPGFRFLGSAIGKFGTMYYYKNGEEYYYESEFDRKMRATIQKNKFKNRTKK